MAMPDAATVIGLGFSLFGVGVCARLVADAVVRVKRFQRETERPPVPAPIDASVLARLERIERIVETTAVEMERVSEGHRYVARLLSESRALPSPRAPERVVTPH